MASARYVQLLWQRKLVILSTLLVTLAVVGLGSYLMTPVYSASATIRIAHGQGGSASYTELMYADRLTNTYVHLLRSRPFLEQVIQRLSLRTTPDALAAGIKVEPLANTELIRVRAESPSPSQAVAIANALAALILEHSQQAYTGQGRGITQTLQERVNSAEQRLREDRTLLERLSQERQSTPQPDPTLLATMQEVNGRLLQEEQIYLSLLGDYDRARAEEAARMGNVTVVELATLPQFPSRPRPPLYLALGALLGLVGGAGLALLIERLDGRIRSMEDLRAVAGIPVLGWVPYLQPPERLAGSAPLKEAGRSATQEVLRALGVTLLSLAATSQVGRLRPDRALMVAGLDPKTGGSSIVADLAAAMARAGHRVVAVDGNLRDPSLHRPFDLPNEPGLADILEDPSKLAGSLRETRQPGLRVLPAGAPTASLWALLNRSRIRQVMRTLAKDADLVLVDAPPVRAFADASHLAPHVWGVLLVVAEDRAVERHIQQAARQLERAGGRVLGIVVCRARPPGDNHTHHLFHVGNGRDSGRPQGQPLRSHVAE